ncbi:alpha-2-HS-glycoprotein [Choloepus didactylus]|uniref:alpha-2-HS-glycoprotein n=1 Tax=Choloepus didactylus TaxID=27675 RepID=UPI00189F2BBF|nr:alpha-2-HS-glycoprotein [Choloepus didactylus]
MKSLVLLLCLVQLWGCHSAPHGPELGFRKLNCDDPETEQVAQVALDYINDHLVMGYKHVLNQIDKAKWWFRRPMGEIYELEIDTLETTCHAREPTRAENCTVRQVAEHAVEGDCEVRLLKLDGQLRVVFIKCDSSPDSAEDVRKVCADCPLLVSINHAKVVHAVEEALAAFNSQSNGSYYLLEEISRAQLVPFPASTYVEFVVAASDCVAKEVTDPAKCKLLAEKQYAFCKATLFEKDGGEEVAVTCKVFQTQPVVPTPQPEDTVEALRTPGVGLSVPTTPTDQPATALEGKPMVVEPPPGPPLVHRKHHDLRHTFPGMHSLESASGEVFSPVKPHVEVKPGVLLPGSPVVHPCPGRIRHFKV